MQNIPISEARNQMTSLPETLTAESGAVCHYTTRKACTGYYAMGII